MQYSVVPPTDLHMPISPKHEREDSNVSILINNNPVKRYPEKRSHTQASISPF
jgi:hypothetical protein